MKILLLALFGLTVTAAATAVTGDWSPLEDEKLVQAAAAAALNEGSANLHRVTESTFKMDPAVSALCVLAGKMRLHNPHADYYCHVFVNDLALKPMKSGEGTYPEGSLIIKQKFSDQRGVNTQLFTIMRKMAAGYDAANHDWEYSIVDASAKTVLSRGRTDSCINCHTDYQSTDYVTRIYMAADSE